MTDQTPPVDPAVSAPPPTGPAATAKQLAEQAIDATAGVAKLAVDVPKETAKLLLAETKKLVARLEGILDPDDAKK